MLSIVVPENQLKGSYSKVLLVYTFGIARDSIALMEDTIFPFYFLSHQFVTAGSRLRREEERILLAWTPDCPLSLF